MKLVLQIDPKKYQNLIFQFMIQSCNHHFFLLHYFSISEEMQVSINFFKLIKMLIYLVSVYVCTTWRMLNVNVVLKSNVISRKFNSTLFYKIFPRIYCFFFAHWYICEFFKSFVKLSKYNFPSQIIMLITLIMSSSSSAKWDQ